MKLTGPALEARLGDALDLATVQKAAGGFGGLEGLRASAQLGPEVSDAKLRAAARELLIAATTAKLEAMAEVVGTPPAPTTPQLVPGLRLGDFRLGRTGDSARGPDPVLMPPSTGDLKRARIRLAVLRPGRKLRSDDVRFLLGQTAFATRVAIAGSRWMSDRVEHAFTPENIQGACGYGQACSVFHLEDLGISPERIHLHQAADAFDGPSPFRHAFVVAEMPDGKPYLIDCTFRQFFQPEHSAPDQVGGPGARMRSTLRGRQISDQLLADGFVELTDEVARLYGSALSGGDGGTQASLLRSTAVIDYDREEATALPAPPPLPEASPARQPKGLPLNRGPP